MPNPAQMAQIMMVDFSNWSICNPQNHLHLAAGNNANNANVAGLATVNADAALHMACNALLGRRKSTAQVLQTGNRAYANGGGICTTSAFAVAARLLGNNQINDRIEIIGQTGANGHMWVVVGRQGGTNLVGAGVGARRRPANAHANWGNYFVLDAWFKALGHPGHYASPPGGHHAFVTNNHNLLEITYDSTVPTGD